MKYRSDFVTNSSSSSFIFTDNLLKKRKQTVADYIVKHFSDQPAVLQIEQEWHREEFDRDFEWIAHDLVPMKECSFLDAQELTDWYDEELQTIALIGVEAFLANDRTPYSREALDRIIHEGSFSEEARQRLTALLALRFLFDTSSWNPLEPEGIRKDVFRREMIDELYLVISEEFLWYNEWSQWLRDFFYQQYEGLPALLEPYIGASVGALLEAILGPCYLFFVDYEFPYPNLSDALSHLPSCILGRSHMG